MSLTKVPFPCFNMAYLLRIMFLYSIDITLILLSNMKIAYIYCIHLITGMKMCCVPFRGSRTPHALESISMVFRQHVALLTLARTGHQTAFLSSYIKILVKLQVIFHSFKPSHFPYLDTDRRIFMQIFI